MKKLLNIFLSAFLISVFLIFSLLFYPVFFLSISIDFLE